MSEFKIEKGIKVPKAHSRGAWAPKYPWRDMAVGDSFFVPGINAAKFAGRISQARLSTGYRFTSRTVDGGVRVWRVK